MKRAAGFVGLAAVLVLLVAVTLWVFGIPVREGIAYLAEGAVGDRFAWSRTLVKSTPLLLTGLGMIVAWRAGMFNIGGEGQFLLGGIFSATAYLALGAVSPWLAVPLMLVSSCIGGALWAALAAWLYVKRGVDVVISTILLNFVAIQFLAYLVAGPLQSKTGGVPLTKLVADEYMLPRLNRQMDVHLGVLLACLIAVLIHVYLFRSVAGYRIRLVGESARMARANLISSSTYRFQAMLVSGALCGLAGGIEHIAMARQIGAGFSQNWGFLGIPVALLAGLNPMAALASAGFFGALFAGSDNLARFTAGGPTLIYVIQAVAVLVVVAWRALSGAKIAANVRTWFRRPQPEST